jgi:zinc and cadmium transporter
MKSNLYWVIGASVLCGVLSIILGSVLLLNKKGKIIANFATAFAAGALLASAFVDIIPEAIEEGLEQNFEPQWVLLIALGGLLFFFLLEGIFHGFHNHSHQEECKNCHEDSCKGCEHEKHNAFHKLFKGKKSKDLKANEVKAIASTSPNLIKVNIDEHAGHSHAGHNHADENQRKKTLSTIMLNLGDSIHNFIDGIAIGSAFLIDLKTGLIVTLAILIHEIPQEIGDASIMFNNGVKRRNILLINLGTALISAVSAVAVYLIGHEFGVNFTPYLGVVAGFFIYIATTDIIPTIHNEKNKKKAAIKMGLLLLGVAIVTVVVILVHQYIGDGHDHDHAHEHAENAFKLVKRFVG